MLGKRSLPLFGSKPRAPDAFRGFHIDHPGNGNAMGRYLEHHNYDAVGNILEMQISWQRARTSAGVSSTQEASSIARPPFSKTS